MTDTWISVDNRMPAPGEKILAYCDRHGICLEIYFPYNYNGKILLSHAGKIGLFYDETDMATEWMP